MGDDFVVAMCHEIEDPTFDATAWATNPHAAVRPIHRPPRVPADRAPVCHWSVTIDPDREPVAAPAALAAVARTRAAELELTPIDPAGPGRWRYDGPLLADVRLEDWSHSALMRIADEVCLQGHLLALSFRAAIEHRISDPHVVDDLVRHQLTGAAGIAATRIVRSMPLGDGPAAVAALLQVHPALLPADYTGVTVDDGDAGDTVTVRISRSSLGVGDGGWAAALASGPLGALDAIAAAVDQRLGFVESDATDDVARVATLVTLDEPRHRADAVALAQLSTGAAFEFRDRGVPVAVAVSRRRPG